MLFANNLEVLKDSNQYYFQHDVLSMALIGTPRPAKLGPTGLLMEWKLPMLINSRNLQVARCCIPTGA